MDQTWGHGSFDGVQQQLGGVMHLSSLARMQAESLATRQDHPPGDVTGALVDHARPGESAPGSFQPVQPPLRWPLPLRTGPDPGALYGGDDEMDRSRPL